MKASDFMVGLILASLIMVLISVVVVGYHQAYPQADYDNSTLEAYNKLDSIAQNADEIRTKVAGIEQNRDALDVIGGFFVSGYNSILITMDSVDLFDEMANSAVKDSSLGVAAFYVKTAMVTIIIILLFVAVVLSAIAKWPI